MIVYRTFAPLPEFYFQELEENGSDLRVHDFETCNFEAYQCPHCGATDRDRLYSLYLEDRLPRTLPDPARVRPSRHRPVNPSVHVHSSQLSNTLSNRRPVHEERGRSSRCYRHGCYAENSFDAFVCSHVLEHVEDDRKAMAELFAF